MALSGDGSTIVGFLSDDQQLPLDVFPWTRAEGRVWHAFDGATPFLWQENRGVWALDGTLRAAGTSLEGWALTDALALSGDGRVVVGRSYCGELQAMFRAVLPD